MSNTVIRVENLSKAYRLGQIGTGTLTNDLKVWWAKVRGRPNPMLKIGKEDHGNRDGETIWALKDINFQVEQGEALGIIGRNGAGKSTLLKILSRVTAPTSGRVNVKGRIASLLEVGTGFHPDLTGRENIYLNGAILGMTKNEVTHKFDEIVDFSGVEQFIDTPVKRYSSGMYVRLAFAVAAHLEPEILVVDEVLAVGDAEFQKKCLGKMGEVAKEGRTVLFVSHNMLAIKSLCGLSMWIDEGKIINYDDTEDVVSQYLKINQDILTEQVWESPETAPGNDLVRLHSARIVSQNGIPIHEVTVETPLRMEFEYWNYYPNSKQSVSIDINDAHGVCIFSSRSDLLVSQKGLIRCECKIPANLLNDGFYQVTFFVVKDYSSWLCSFENVLGIEIHDIRRTIGWLGKWPGVIRPRLEWKLLQRFEF